MAEVTSNSTLTPTCLPPRKRARMEESTADDAFKPVGTLSFLIDNFREFSNLDPGQASKRHSDAKVSVRGLTFRLAVYPVPRMSKEDDPAEEDCNCMGIALKCENASGCDAKGDGSWSCLAYVTMRIKTLLKTREDEVDEFTHRFFFSSKYDSSLEWEDKRPLLFDHLLNPESGLYNEKNNTLELIAEISVDMPTGIMELPKMETIQVNKETVMINKNLLAVHSRYFNSLFYNGQYREGQNGVYEVEIEAPATVEHFKRMLDTMCPTNKPLNDKCIEGVLHLANQFLVADVEGKCLEFLAEKSKKPALFKYRIADKYGYTALKKHVLFNFKATDFKDKLFMANMAEYAQLGSNDAEAMKARFDELFPPDSDQEDD